MLSRGSSGLARARAAAKEDDLGLDDEDAGSPVGPVGIGIGSTPAKKPVLSRGSSGLARARAAAKEDDLGLDDEGASSPVGIGIGIGSTPGKKPSGTQSSGLARARSAHAGPDDNEDLLDETPEALLGFTDEGLASPALSEDLLGFRDEGSPSPGSATRVPSFPRSSIPSFPQSAKEKGSPKHVVAGSFDDLLRSSANMDRVSRGQGSESSRSAADAQSEPEAKKEGGKRRLFGRR